MADGSLSGSPHVSTQALPAAGLYYGWTVMLVAAAAMVGTLPGRTQGLGLITEPLLADLHIDRLSYAELNLWATLLGSAGAFGIGHLIDRFGSRLVLTTVAAALGLVVGAMSQTTTFAGLAVWITLTRALGQSALSVVSLAIVGQWFVRRIDTAMAVYSIVMSVGFMMAFPLVGSLVQSRGWRVSWLSIGVALVLVLAPLAWAIVRCGPESVGLRTDGGGFHGRSYDVGRRGPRGYAWTDAVATPAFWIFASDATS
jgi:MFS family permease